MKKIFLLFIILLLTNISIFGRLPDVDDPEYDLDYKVWEMPYYYLDKSLDNDNYILISSGCTDVHHFNYLHILSIYQKINSYMDFILKWESRDDLFYKFNYYRLGFSFHMNNFYFSLTGNPQFEKKDIDLYFSFGYRNKTIKIEPYICIPKFDNNYSFKWNDLDSMNFYNNAPKIFGSNFELNTDIIKTRINGFWMTPYSMRVVLNKDSAYSFDVDSLNFSGFIDIYPTDFAFIGTKFEYFEFTRITDDTGSVHFKNFHINSYTGALWKANTYYIGLKYANYDLNNYLAGFYTRNVFIPYIGIRADYKWNSFTFEYMKSFGDIANSEFIWTETHTENRFLFLWDIKLNKNVMLNASKGFELDQKDILYGSKYFFYDKAYLQFVISF